MKLKRFIAVVAVMIMVFTMAGAALAIPSPSGLIVSSTENVENVEIKSLTVAKQSSLEDYASDFIADEYGADFSGYTLLAIDLEVVRKDDKPVTFVVNVAGVNEGDTILVVHEKTDGSKEIVGAKVLSEGVIQFTLDSFSPICFIKVASKGWNPTPVMPKTGDDTTMMPVAMLLVVCTVALTVSIKAIRAGK